MGTLVSSLIEGWRARREVRAAARIRPPPAEPRLDRWRSLAWLEARAAVRAGVRLDDFLRHRLAGYATRLPVPLEALPVVIDVEGGEASVRARPAPAPRLGAGAAPAPGPTAGDRWLRALEARDGPAPLREHRELLAAIAALDARIAAGQERVDAIARALADDLASGALVAPAAVDATAEQLGRPPVPSPGPVHLLRAFAALALAAEAWRFADPVLALSGLSVEKLVQDPQRAPATAALALVFALGAAGAVLALVDAAVSRLAELTQEPGDGRRRALRAGGALGAGLAAAAVSACALAPARVCEPVLLLAVPFAAVVAARHAARLDAAREQALVAARAWDQERAREAVACAQRSEALTRAQGALDGISARRAELARRLRALEGRAMRAARAAEAQATAEAHHLDRLAEGLAAALELDRYAFLRLAAEQAAPAPPRPVRAERTARLEATGAPERLGAAG